MEVTHTHGQVIMVLTHIHRVLLDDTHMHGYKTATVTIRSGSETITRTGGVNIQDSNIVSGAYCVANPTNAGINQNVTWTAYVNNANGFFGGYTIFIVR